MKHLLKLPLFIAVLAAFGFVGMGMDSHASSSAGDDSLPNSGLGSYTRAHAMNPNPPDRIGGPLEIKVSVRNGSIRWALPGPRELDPAVFGTPDHPLGWEKNPFPLVGIPINMRQKLCQASSG